MRIVMRNCTPDPDARRYCYVADRPVDDHLGRNTCSVSPTPIRVNVITFLFICPWTFVYHFIRNSEVHYLSDIPEEIQTPEHCFNKINYDEYLRLYINLKTAIKIS
jgi:hypothetical protein